MVWRLLNFQIHDIFENMAIDESIFQKTIKDRKPPTIRFYSSHPEAISIGYFQDIRKEVNIEKCRKAGVDVVRRITGGKAVFHSHEITYCVVAGNQEKTFPPDIAGAYKVISRCIARSLAYLGIKAVLAESGRVGAGEEFKSCCFSVPARSELLVHGRKICGSAQLRKKDGFLQHGSLLLTFDPAKTASLLLPARTPEQLEKLKKAVTAINEELISPVAVQDVCLQLKKGFTDELGIELEEDTATAAEKNLMRELKNKYNDGRWNIKEKRTYKAGCLSP